MLLRTVLGGDKQSGATLPSRAGRRERGTSDVVPVCNVHRLARGSRGWERLVREWELSVRHVLDDQEPVVLRQRDEKCSLPGGKADTGRVLVVGDAVDELRAKPTCKTPLEVFHVEPVLVHADRDERRLEASERLDRAQVRGGFDNDQVARIQEGLGDQLERLDGAARDQQLVVGRAATLQGLEPTRECVQ